MDTSNLRLEWIDPKTLTPNPANWRRHPKAQKDALEAVIAEVGWAGALLFNERTNRLIDGHLRQEISRDGPVPVLVGSWSEEQERLILATLDPIAALAEAESSALDALLKTVEAESAAVKALLERLAAQEGIDLGGELVAVSGIQARVTLAERFVVPPFSVLDARQGYWQKRKRAWIALGIKGEIGRGRVLSSLDSAVAVSESRVKRHSKIERALLAGVSVFDPVLCECAYAWFCPLAGLVLDPFAGGSVRGIVACYLGREYMGIELRPEQVEANRAQAQAIGVEPRWIVGDAANVREVAAGEYDFIFSCPPYYDLEVYSDLPGELSALATYDDFVAQYRAVVSDSVAMLKDNRFACFVVGDIRSRQGFYRNFVSDTIAAFQDAGAMLYNEAILVTAIGSLPIRVGKQFLAGRKLGKTHQNVLVFIKGDWRKAIVACGPVEPCDLEHLSGMGLELRRAE